VKEVSRPRPGLFLVAVAVLIAAAALISPAPHRRASPARAAPSPALAPSFALLDGARREEVRLRVAGRRFVSAFLRFEVGDLSPQVKQHLHDSTTAAFARDLEAAPARRLTRRPFEAARIERLEVSFLTASAHRALLSGTARRRDGPEEFSFLFALRGGRWRALGVAE
jgi:hypothetical protein